MGKGRLTAGTERLSTGAARRMALAAQGFATPRPSGPVQVRHLRQVISQLGLLQLDSVNVFCRSHYLPLFSRLGPYPRELIDQLAGHRSSVEGRKALEPRQAAEPRHAAVPRQTARPARLAGPRPRELFEYWGHEASLLPLATQPLLRWRMARADREAWSSVSAIARDDPSLVAQVLALVGEQGPIRAADTGVERAKPVPGQMWNWHAGKIALEYLFYAGQVAAAGRVNFERHYDLPERVLPAAILGAPAPAEADAQRELVRIAARALGVATEPDLGDYFRLPRAASRAAVADLVESGELIPATVEGWPMPAYCWAEARRPRRVDARALLSPFDSLVWFRERTERLFGFRYRIEIYTPAAKRVYGYYVLPFLLGDSLVARVDLKTDRQAGVLRVQAAYAEPDVDLAAVAGPLAAELAEVARWLELDEVVVAPKGDLAAALLTG